jgi:hypothetical protein
LIASCDKLSASSTTNVPLYIIVHVLVSPNIVNDTSISLGLLLVFASNGSLVTSLSKSRGTIVSSYHAFIDRLPFTWIVVVVASLATSSAVIEKEFISVGIHSRNVAYP